LHFSPRCRLGIGRSRVASDNLRSWALRVMRTEHKPALGVLWDPAAQVANPLRSTSVVGATLLDALSRFSLPKIYRGPTDPNGHGAALAMSAFLAGLDLVMGEAYPSHGVELALAVRSTTGASFPVVLFAHGAAPKALEGMLFDWRDQLRPGDALVFTSRADREIWTRLVDDSRLAEHVIAVPVDGLFFHPESDPVQVRRGLGVTEDADLIVYPGRINVQKNIHGLLRAFAMLRQSRPMAHLVLAGPDDNVALREFGVLNTGYRAYLDRLACQLGVSDYVSRVGELRRAELAKLLDASDMACSLSFYHRENFGLALAEAQAAGLPVVASAWAGHRDVVDPDRGQLVEAVLSDHGIRVDWASAAHAMAELLGDDGIRQEAGRSARRWARRFSVEAVSGQLQALVRSVLEGANRVGPDPAYRSSAFARAYEEHKRLHGWYAADDPHAPWRRPMFEGADYRLYETMFGTYASCTARLTSAESLDDLAFPYPSSPLRLDESRRLVLLDDPIWPHRRYLDKGAWEVIMSVSGTRPVRDIVGGDPGRRLALWRLWVDGLIQLSARPVPATPSGSQPSPTHSSARAATADGA
jgi:glycosyltransferase involved in cell wall biosynthesis